MNDFDQEENLKDMAAFIQNAGYIHRSELEELIEEWRDKADSAPHDMCVEKMYDCAADDLEEVLEE